MFARQWTRKVLEAFFPTLTAASMGDLPGLGIALPSLLVGLLVGALTARSWDS